MPRRKKSAREPKKVEYVCGRCGGVNVEHAMWVNLNTDQVGDCYGSWCCGDNAYCADCDDNNIDIVPADKYVPKSSDER